MAKIDKYPETWKQKYATRERANNFLKYIEGQTKDQVRGEFIIIGTPPDWGRFTDVGMGIFLVESAESGERYQLITYESKLNRLECDLTDAYNANREIPRIRFEAISRRIHQDASHIYWLVNIEYIGIATKEVYIWEKDAIEEMQKELDRLREKISNAERKEG